VRASSPRESTLRSTPSTEPVLFLRAWAPVGDTTFDACARWPSARCCRWESLHHEIHRPLTSPVACRHPLAAPSAESSSRMSFSRACPTYAADLATDDSSDECLRTRQKLRPRRLSTTFPEKTCMARAALTPPQWRDDAASTRNAFHRIDWLPACACNPKCREFLVEHVGTPHTSSSGLWPWTASGGIPRRPSTSVWLSSRALRRCSVHPHDANDRLLPSTASISSTRASFAPDEIASRAHGFFTDSVFAACPGGVASRRTHNQAPSVFTTLKWLWWIAASVFASHPNVEAFYSSALVVNRTSDAPVAPLGCTGLRIPSHRPTHPHDAETASKRDPWRSHPSAIWRAFHRKVHFFSWRLATPTARNVGLGPHHASLLDAGGFAATRPCTTPLHRDDAVLLFANTVVSIRPPFTPADRFDAGASLSQT